MWMHLLWMIPNCWKTPAVTLTTGAGKAPDWTKRLASCRERSAKTWRFWCSWGVGIESWCFMIFDENNLHKSLQGRGSKSMITTGCKLNQILRESSGQHIEAGTSSKFHAPHPARPGCTREGEPWEQNPNHQNGGLLGPLSCGISILVPRTNAHQDFSGGMPYLD